MTEERARMIVDKFDWINVSLDTTDPVQYAKIRGASFYKVKKNIERIRDLKREAGKKNEDSPRLGLCFIITEYSYTNILEIVDMAKDLEARWINLQAPWKGTYEKENILFDRAKTEKYLSLVTIAEDKIKGSGIIIIDRTVNVILSNFPDLRKQLYINPHRRNLGKGPQTCDIPYSALHITSYGNVFFCCTSPTPLGNINNDPVPNIWNSSAALEMRKRLQLGGYSKDCKENCVRGYILPSYYKETEQKKIKTRFSNCLLQNIKSLIKLK